MPDEPTLGEDVRRLTDAIGRLERTVDRMDSKFVPREMYERDRDATKAEFVDIRGDVAEVKAEQRDSEKWRRSTSLTVAIAAGGWLLTLIGLVVAVAALLKG